MNPSVMFVKSTVMTTGVPIRKYSKKESKVTQAAYFFRICVIFHVVFLFNLNSCVVFWASQSELLR